MIDFASTALEFVVVTVIGFVGINLLVLACLAAFLGVVRARELMLRYYRWLARLYLDLLKAIAFCAGFFVCAMATVWLLGIVKFN